MKDQLRFIVARDVNLPYKIFSTTLNVVIFLTVTCNSAIDSKGIVAFSLKQWLRIFRWFIPVVCDHNITIDIRWVSQNTTKLY